MVTLKPNLVRRKPSFTPETIMIIHLTHLFRTRPEGKPTEAQWWEAAKRMYEPSLLSKLMYFHIEEIKEKSIREVEPLAE